MIKLIKYFKLFIKFCLIFFLIHNLLIDSFQFSFLCELYTLITLNKLINSMAQMALLFLLMRVMKFVNDLKSTTLFNFLTYSKTIVICLLIVIQKVLAFRLFLVKYYALLDIIGTCLWNDLIDYNYLFLTIYSANFLCIFSFF